MARPATVFTCSACGHEAPKWHGRCPGCGEWNTLVEERRAPAPARRGGGGRASAPAPRRPGPARRRPGRRRSRACQTGIGELDRVLGGGLVPGSLVLLGGSPGIGKSTLTSMALGNLAGAGRRTLYVSGEESAAQIKLRAERLPGAALEVPVLAETDLDTVLATLEAERPEVCVIDSVQTLHAADLTGAAGSVGPGARGRRPDHAARQGARHRRAARRPRDQGGRARRPARARAPRRLRAAVRGRARAHLPHAARAQEPLRLDQRGRRVRDAPGRAGRGPGRERALRRRGDARARAASCSRRWRARGRCWSRSRRSCRRPSSCRRGASPTGSTATGSRSCSRCSRATRASASAAPTCSSTSPAACGSTSPAPTWRSRWRSRAPRAASSPAAGERPLACFGEIGLTGELRSVAHPERRLAEAAKFGLKPTVAPVGAGRGATEAPTLRAGAEGALGRRTRRRAAA